MNTIIWDWNGTLLNDAWFCVDTINKILKKYNLQPIDLETYRQIFSFPVKDYYKKIGFDFEKIPFEIVGKEYIDIYDAEIYKKVKLQPYSKEILQDFKNKGFRQVIISAREKQSLIKDLKFYLIYDYFDDVLGIEDIYGGGKKHILEKFLSKQSADNKFVMIGDTVYDCQLANDFNIKSVLVSNGHNSLERLKKCNVPLVNNLSEVKPIIEKLFSK